MKKYTRLILLLGDLGALFLFVIIGEWSHGLSQTNLPITFLPLAVLWLIAGSLLNAFPSANAINLRSLIGNAINCWLIVIPLGLFARALVQASPVIIVQFMAAALGFSGLFVLAWRIVFFFLWRFAHPPVP